MSRAVIIGGGVVGLSSAYYLSKQGWQVTLVDRGRIGGGCSHGNCGLICPSHALPLAEPGAVGRALFAMLRRNAPFLIKPRLDLSLWSWLLRFARRCNSRDMLAAGHACQALLDSSMSLYRGLIPEESIECEWESRGLLFVYRTRKALDSFAHVDALLSEQFHLPARRLDAQSLVEFEPALADGLAGGYYYEHDAHVRPDRLVAQWRRVVEARGVEILEDCEFQGFDESAQPRTAGAPAAEHGLHHAVKEATLRGRSTAGSLRRASRAITSRGELAADAFVVATGAWTPLLSKHIGCRLPIQPGKGYSLTMPRPAICPRVPLILAEDHVAVTPMQSGYRLGSLMEFAGYDASLRPERLDILRRGAAACLREPYCEPVEEAWFGWRPMTYDSVPIIGPAPRWDNLYVAAGHNMLGLSMAPATGKLVAELMSGASPHIDPAPYSILRFG